MWAKLVYTWVRGTRPIDQHLDLDLEVEVDVDVLRDLSKSRSLRPRWCAPQPARRPPPGLF